MSIFKTIYLAGGCFWGMQGYFDIIGYIKDTVAGYANSVVENPNYETVCKGETDAVEALKITYDKRFISLYEILIRYLKVIDPFSVNRQANDTGRQYRTGIYYEDVEDKKTIEIFLDHIEKIYNKKPAIEYMHIKNFHRAEEYHQKYLEKNPDGYCHVNLSLAEQMLINPKDFISKNLKEKIKKLNTTQYLVTQKNQTEPPFKNIYNENFKKGLYTDIVSGEPLFLSKDKFECDCGWPAFSRPLFHDSVIYNIDNRFNMKRVEVKSTISLSHLGHVFDDGPESLTSLRYCINSSSLDFVPFENMKGTKYEKLMFLFDF